MTPRSLFTVILKIFGLYFIRDLFISIPQLLSVILFFKTGQTTEAIRTLITSAAIFAIEGWVIYFLLFKTEWIIEKLKLTTGFDQDIIPFNMHRSSVIQMSVIIICGLLLADEIPNLCRRVYTYIQQRQMKYGEYNRETPFIVISVVKIILAGLILAEYRRIVSLIVRKKNPAADIASAED